MAIDQSSFAFKALLFYGTRIRHRGQWRVHSKLRDILNANADCYMEVERAGLHWVLNPSDYVQQNLFWLGVHDRWDIQHIKQLLPPDPVIFDVGANFGYYSITLAASLGRTARIFAFEPHPETRARLARHVQLNGLDDVVTVMPYALSDNIGSSHMQGREGNTGAAHLSSDGETEVQVTTLDSICHERKLSRLDFIKIDVEGFETLVLKGADNSLRTFRPALLVEMMPQQLARTGSSAEELVRTLRDHGYELYVSNREQLLHLTALPKDLELINVFCIPADRAAQALLPRSA